jgi:two-component system chemotaxis sensor kinase CheA
MEKDLSALEAAPTSSQIIRRVFRTVHAVKGVADFLGLSSLQELTNHTERLIGQLRAGQHSFTPDLAMALRSTVSKCREGLKLIRTHGGDNTLDAADLVQQLKRLEEASPSTPANTEAAVPAPGKTESAQLAASDKCESYAGDKGPTATDTTIRVDVALLDKLMTRVGELVLARNQILQLASGLEDAGFSNTAQRLNLITTELQESVMKTRMQPIGNVWAKFPRVVRDLAGQLQKQVRIEMEGKETELDKTIVEAIKDPLTHIVRNAVDHGIESPQVRLAAGKSPEGLLFLRAFHEGGQVNIEITDDGAGLNIDRIRRKAVERGMASADQAARMTDRELAQFVMMPGFSTAEQVTNLSGRGVGMDVVRTNIEHIGGMIDLQSKPGQGTTIKIKIPLTLAIIPALVVTSEGDRYAIPQVNLLELVRLEPDQAKREIEFIHGAPVYRLRGKLLPLLYLSEQLRQPSPPDTTSTVGVEDRVFNIVVLRANDSQFGLVVDKVNDTEEIVVKPLSRQLKNLREYAGATIMGDGTIALILDVVGLAVAAGIAGEMKDQSIANGMTSEAKASDTTQSLLIVDLGDSRRFALPASMVSRLEKAPLSSVEWADGKEVLQYRGAILPLIRLAKVFGSMPVVAENDELQIVVFKERDQSFGLIVHRIVDVIETELQWQMRKGEESNLIGTAVIQQRVADVLNLSNIAKNESNQACAC